MVPSAAYTALEEASVETSISDGSQIVSTVSTTAVGSLVAPPIAVINPATVILAPKKLDLIIVRCVVKFSIFFSL